MTTFKETTIDGAWIVNPVRHGDERGWFQELFKESAVVRETGIEFQPVQINVSHSMQGVIRGIHYSIAQQGQGKYISVLAGEIDDYIIDVRIGSPTFGKWERVRLSSEIGNSVLLGTNLAHAFQVVSPIATVCYAVTAEFNPDAEKAIHPLCSTLGISWKTQVDILLSEKDQSAPSLNEQTKLGLLPNWNP